MYHFFKDNNVLLTEVSKTKYKYRGFNKKTGYVDFEYHYHYKGCHFKRHYSFHVEPKRNKKEYYKELSIRVLDDHKNGTIKRQIEFEFKPHKTRKVLAPVLASLLVAGATGGTLYALKDVIWGGGSTKTYKVTYNCGDGSIGDKKILQVDEEANIQTAPYPSRLNYTFDCCCKDSECTQAVAFPKVIDSDTTLSC